MRLKNKVAVITGAASGMGLAMAKRFAKEGACVVAGDWNTERLCEAVDEIKQAGGNIIGQQGDISNKDTARQLIELAVKDFGAVDVLCNNAGIADNMQGVGETSDELWQRVMDINLNAPMITSRAAVKHMLNNNGGSIINISSVAGLHGGIAGASYTSAKHALIGLTKNTAWMYTKQGIRCNAICPGATATNITETLPPDITGTDGLARTEEVNALAPGLLEPYDIASLALFLASDESRMINGAIIPADAGWHAG